MGSFGADTLVALAQAAADALNKYGWQDSRAMAAVKAWQVMHGGLTADGKYGPLSAAAMAQDLGAGKAPAAYTTGSAPSGSNGGGTTAPTVSIATVAAALKQAAKEKGYDISDNLVSLMIGQLRGAEGAYPGVKSTLGGTNNYGATNATSSFVAKIKLLPQAEQAGWGILFHKDSDPNKGPYLSGFYIAPTPLAGARHWFQDNWWGPRLAQNNPTTPEAYAAILYSGGYFGGVHPGDTKHDPNSDAGKLNVQDYANAIRRGMPRPGELNNPGNPDVLTVDPSQFAPLAKRGITQDLYDKAMGGGMGSAFRQFLPPTWDEFVNANGVVWIVPPPILKAFHFQSTFIKDHPKLVKGGLIAMLVGIGTGLVYLILEATHIVKGGKRK